MSEDSILAARATIESLRLTDDQSLADVAALRFTPEGSRAAELVLSSRTASRDQVWAALWVAGSGSVDAEVVAAQLAHEDSSIRALSAAILLSVGDARALEPLTRALSDDGHLIGSEPPMSVADFSAMTFDTYVDAATAPSEPVDSEASGEWRSAWADWLNANATSLEFAGDEGTWRVR